MRCILNAMRTDELRVFAWRKIDNFGQCAGGAVLGTEELEDTGEKQGYAKEPLFGIEIGSLPAPD